MPKNRHLTDYERDQIEYHLKEVLPLKRIAEELGRSNNHTKNKEPVAVANTGFLLAQHTMIYPNGRMILKKFCTRFAMV